MQRRIGVIMYKKGIGPVIAFVLLLALSVTLGAFVTIWYTKSTEGQVKTVIEKYGNADECSDVRFDVSFDYENCYAAVYNLGSFTIDEVKVDKYFSTDLTTAKSEIWAAGISPKDCITIPMNNSDENSEPRQVLFAPIIINKEERTLCLNERVYEPNGSKFLGCPGPVIKCSEL
ncbi:MAG: hypothetical protein V1734_01080 [Nanoarchaeota archaeon]